MREKLHRNDSSLIVACAVFDCGVHRKRRTETEHTEKEYIEKDIELSVLSVRCPLNVNYVPHSLLHGSDSPTNHPFNEIVI